MERYNAKITDLQTAVRRAAAARQAGSVVVFTNGCFDILHDGHRHTLRKAKEQGDILIVGLNSDNSVRTLKGPTRPVNSELKRAEILSQVAVVDVVVVFEEATADRLLKAIRPDVYVKGADYNEETLPEALTAKACGARLSFVPPLPNVSTSRLVTEMTGRDGRDTHSSNST